MKLILNEEETKEYLKDLKRAKEIYEKHNRLIELLDSCLIVKKRTIKIHKLLSEEEMKELNKLFGRFYYEEFEG